MTILRSISEIAHLLGVNRELIRTLAFDFRDYLSNTANPGKGISRQFSAKDLQVLAYASAHWDGDSDYDHIKIGLNRGNHNQEPYNDILAYVKPLFQELPEELDETHQHGCLVGGFADAALDTFALADSYKLAGDKLIDTALLNEEAYELVRPIMYNYRHATELYLKAILLPKDKDHNLKKLLEQLRDYLKCNHSSVIPSWFENLIIAFDDFDSDSTTFRYTDTEIFSRSTGDTGEFWVDLPHIKKLMDWLAKSFEKIRQSQKNV